MYEDYYDQEPYYEPTLADEILIEYQQKMKDALLESVKSEIEDIRNVNNQLIAENKTLKEKEQNIGWRERQLDSREETLKNTLERDFYRKKFSELLKPFEEKFAGYFAESTRPLIKKCKDCDKDRQITYTAPNGETIKKNCSCLKSYMKYVPKHTVIDTLDLYKSKDSYKKDFVITPKYEYSSDYDYNYSKLKLTQFFEVFDESKIEGLKERDILFSLKEECKKYCDWLNKNIKDKVEEENDEDKEF